MVLGIDVISLLAIFVMWFLTILYIVVIRKYEYDKYSRHWDGLKKWYAVTLIVFIGISLLRAPFFYQSDKIYSVVSIVLLIIILCCVFTFYIFRTIIYRNETSTKKRRIDTSKITVKELKKVVIITSVTVLVYFIYSWAVWLFFK